MVKSLFCMSVAGDLRLLLLNVASLSYDLFYMAN